MVSLRNPDPFQEAEAGRERKESGHMQYKREFGSGRNVPRR